MDPLGMGVSQRREPHKFKYMKTKRNIWMYHICFTCSMIIICCMRLTECISNVSRIPPARLGPYKLLIVDDLFGPPIWATSVTPSGMFRGGFINTGQNKMYVCITHVQNFMCCAKPKPTQELGLVQGRGAGPVGAVPARASGRCGIKASAAKGCCATATPEQGPMLERGWGQARCWCRAGGTE